MIMIMIVTMLSIGDVVLWHAKITQLLMTLRRRVRIHCASPVNAEAYSAAVAVWRMVRVVGHTEVTNPLVTVITI